MREPDLHGRVWMHCESGLSLTKASMTRFIMHVLENRIEIGQIYAFNPKYKGSLVLATLLLRPDQFEKFEKATGGKLRKPPVIHLNSGGEFE